MVHFTAAHSSCHCLVKTREVQLHQVNDEHYKMKTRMSSLHGDDEYTVILRMSNELKKKDEMGKELNSESNELTEMQWHQCTGTVGDSPMHTR